MNAGLNGMQSARKETTSVERLHTNAQPHKLICLFPNYMSKEFLRIPNIQAENDITAMNRVYLIALISFVRCYVAIGAYCWSWTDTALDLGFIVWPRAWIRSSDYMMGKRKLIERARKRKREHKPGVATATTIYSHQLHTPHTMTASIIHNFISPFRQHGESANLEAIQICFIITEAWKIREYHGVPCERWRFRLEGHHEMILIL